MVCREYLCPLSLKGSPCVPASGLYRTAVCPSPACACSETPLSAACPWRAWCLPLQIAWLGCPKAAPATTTDRSRCRCWPGSSSRTSPWAPSTRWPCPPQGTSTPGAATQKARYTLFSAPDLWEPLAALHTCAGHGFPLVEKRAWTFPSLLHPSAWSCFRQLALFSCLVSVLFHGTSLGKDSKDAIQIILIQAF